MSYYHRFIQIQAYKHDGSFHRLWSHGFVVRDDEDYIVVASNRARIIESNDHTWHTKERAVFIFSKKEWFNTIVTFREDGIHYYVNIASPSIVDKGFIKFIDYDLDVKGFPSGFVKVLDVNEFNAHCKKYNYSDELKDVLKKMLEETIDKINKKENPYNEETVNNYWNNFETYFKNQETSDREKRNNKPNNDKLNQGGENNGEHVDK